MCNHFIRFTSYTELGLTNLSMLTWNILRALPSNRNVNVRNIPIEKSSEQNLKKRFFIHAVLSEKAVFSKWQYFKRKARYSWNKASVFSIVPLLRNQVASQLHFSFRITVIRLFLSWCFLFIHVEPYIKQHLQKIVETNYSFIIIRQSLSGKRSTWCTDKSSRLLHRASSSCTMLMFTRQWLIWLTVVATFFHLPFYIEVQS